MFRKLDLDSEKVAASGSLIATGVMKVLGQPNMESLAVLVREAIQNSWDARLYAHGGVDFGIDGWTLSAEQRRLLRTKVISAYPDHSLPHLSKQLHATTPIHVLAVWDRGTLGLGGPTRADVVIDTGEPNDFVDFLRNVGQPPEKQMSGGTYGYGKAAFYRASRVHTIIVYTRCKYQGKYETRFIAAALGDPYLAGNIRYTGRHWWGRNRRSVAEPVLDNEADALAEGLGIPIFSVTETGTTILVLQPTFSTQHQSKRRSAGDESDRTPEQAVNMMAEQILLYFWPKMLTFDEEGPAISFHASWQSKSIHIPHPLDFDPLKGFVAAMYRLKGTAPHMPMPYKNYVGEIKSLRPAKLLGRLAIQQHTTELVPPFDTGNSGSAFQDLTHHTALMRQPELIVKYLRGDPLPSGGWGYSGVFITDKEVDSVFASSEPPAHDDWVSKGLEEDWHRRYVNVALREIESAMSEFAVPPKVSAASSSGLAPLAAFADKLGQSLLAAELGPSAAVLSFGTGQQGASLSDGSTNGAGSGKSTPQTSAASPEVGPASGVLPALVFGRSRVQIVGEDFMLFDSQPALQVRFVVHHAKGYKFTHARAEAKVVIDGAQAEADPPFGANQPRVLTWQSPQGEMIANQDSVSIPANSTDEWAVVVSLPQNVMIDVNIKTISSNSHAASS